MLDADIALDPEEQMATRSRIGMLAPSIISSACDSSQYKLVRDKLLEEAQCGCTGIARVLPLLMLSILEPEDPSA